MKSNLYKYRIIETPQNDGDKRYSMQRRKLGILKLWKPVYITYEATLSRDDTIKEAEFLIRIDNGMYGRQIKSKAILK